MPGGNTSSSKHGLKNIKGTSQFANDVKHQNAVETFANPGNLMIDAAHGEDYTPDVNFGLPMSGQIPETPGDTQGNSGWKGVNPGPGVTRSRNPGSGGNSTPGGGW